MQTDAADWWGGSGGRTGNALINTTKIVINVFHLSTKNETQQVS